MILQFGAGNFLRAFIDLFAAQLNRDTDTAVGPIVVVQSTGIERARALNDAGCRYHVAIQGYEDGEIIDRTELSDSISHALHAGTQWDEVLSTACDSTLQMIVSNTTEAGFVLDEADTSNEGTPRSFPAKLLACLLARHRSGGEPVLIIPCELIEHNGDALRRLVLEQAARWNLDETTVAWVGDSCRWVNNLVDRIVPGPPKKHPLLGKDPLLLSAEPYAFWGIETDGKFPFSHHPSVRTTTDLAPYYLRKVRILNGLHSALVCHAMPLGIATVREAVEHPEVGPWLEQLLFEEILPVLDGRVNNPEKFAKTTLNRFRNPFLEHALSSTALNHEAKVRVRMLPTYQDFLEKFGRPPRLLTAAMREAGFDPTTSTNSSTTNRILIRH